MSKVFISDRITNPDIERNILGEYLATEPNSDIEILMVWHQVVDSAYLNNFPNLKGIIRYGVGFDKINLKDCAERNITVCNNPDYCTEEVSNTATAMILNSSRCISRYDESARHYASGWQENVLPNIVRSSASTIGFIGLGRTGSMTLTACQASRYKTQFFDPYLSEGIDKVVNSKRVYSLDELLKTSDIVSVHCPLDEHTRGMIDSDFINKMKPGSSLVNTARGQIVESLDCIYDGLKSNHLNMVSLDVLPDEPPKPHPLTTAWRQRDSWLEGRLVINPHAAYHSIESGNEQRRKAAENALKAISTGKFHNVV